VPISIWHLPNFSLSLSLSLSLSHKYIHSAEITKSHRLFWTKNPNVLFLPLFSLSILILPILSVDSRLHYQTAPFRSQDSSICISQLISLLSKFNNPIRLDSILLDSIRFSLRDRNGSIFYESLNKSKTCQDLRRKGMTILVMVQRRHIRPPPMTFGPSLPKMFPATSSRRF
jgi:hypothetical protein